MFLAAATMFSSCSTDKDLSAPAPAQQAVSQNQNGNVELSANTKIVSEKINSALTEATEGKLVFRGEDKFLEQVKAGDILVAAPNEVAVDGYLRNVTRVEKTGDSYVFYTSQAKIEQAVKNATIRMKAPIAFKGGNRKIKGDQQEAYSQNFSHSMPLNYIIYDVDGNYSSTYDQIKTNGSLTFSANMYLDMNISNNQLTYFYATSDFGMTHNQNVVIGGSVSASGSIRVFQSVLPNLTFTVGILPITVKPTMEVFLGYSGSATAQVTFGYTGRANAKPIIQFTSGAWSYGFNRSISATRNPVSSVVSATMTGLIKPKVTMALYGCTCASAYAQGEIYVTLKSTASPASVQVSAGVKGGAGANLFGYAPANNAIFNLPIGL